MFLKKENKWALQGRKVAWHFGELTSGLRHASEMALRTEVTRCITGQQGLQVCFS